MLELNEATREEWNFTCFVFSLPDILFQLWSGPTVLFCFVFMIFGIFATCKIEGVKTELNVKTFYNY